MWMRIGGRNSGVLAGAALVLLIAPFVALAIVMHNAFPIALIAAVLGFWVLACAAALAPVIVAKAITLARKRRRIR